MPTSSTCAADTNCDISRLAQEQVTCRCGVGVAGSVPPSVAVVVLNWNQRQLTLDCLASVYALHYPDPVVILVDNASTDGTAEAVLQHYPSTVIIENDANLGYAGGNNVGIRRALDLGVDYVVVLNNDTTVDPAFVDELVSVAKSDSRVGVVGPATYYSSDPDVVWSAGNSICWATGQVGRYHADARGFELREPYSADYLTGCALCIKREALELVGLLDERFFLCYEETDWCVRARHAGYGVLVAPRARLWHKVSATIGEGSPTTTYYMTRNASLFFSKHLRGRRLVRTQAAIWRRELRTIAAQTIRPRYAHLRSNRNVRILALRDALLRRWGRMGPDVARACGCLP